MLLHLLAEILGCLLLEAMIQGCSFVIDALLFPVRVWRDTHPSGDPKGDLSMGEYLIRTPR